MDWITFSFAVVTSLASGGLLAWGLDLWKFRHEAGRSQWQDFLDSYEKQIESAEKRQDDEETHRLRREYEGQIEAWRAQQEIKGLDLGKVSLEEAPALSQEEVTKLKQLLATSENLSAAVLSPEDCWLRGNALFRAGDYEEALAAFDRALALRPEDTHVGYHRGLALGELGREQEALEAFDRALAARPQFVEARHNRGVMLLKLGRYQEALEAFDQALAQRSGWPRAQFNRGLALVGLGRNQEALEVFDRVLTMRPGDPKAYESRGLALMGLRRYQEAMEAFDCVLALWPEQAETRVNRGHALLGLGHHQEALEAYDKALALQPDHAGAMYYKACAYSLMRHGEAALEWLGRAIKADEKYRTMAQTDQDFAFLREPAKYGPRFRALVGE